MPAEFEKVQWNSERGTAQLARTREETVIMTVGRDLLAARGDNIVRWVNDVVEIFPDCATDLMN